MGTAVRWLAVSTPASYREAYSGGLSEAEIELLYGGLIQEAEVEFSRDVSLLADIATSGLPANP